MVAAQHQLRNTGKTKGLLSRDIKKVAVCSLHAFLAVRVPCSGCSASVLGACCAPLPAYSMHVAGLTSIPACLYLCCSAIGGEAVSASGSSGHRVHLRDGRLLLAAACAQQVSPGCP